MSFEPTQEDERKLHNEITEIGRQRFVLTTLAVTLFGVLTAWMVPKEFPKENTSIGPFPFAISMIISILLFSIYLWHHMLRTHLQILANYLIVAGKSNWEVQFV
jgi:hypothetical protein